MKRFVANVVDRLGYVIVPKWRSRDLALANRLRLIFSHFGIDRVIDIGANEGQFGTFLRETVGFSGWIHSCEPIPEIVGKLQLRKKDDAKWVIRPCALGKEPGELPIN